MKSKLTLKRSFPEENKLLQTIPGVSAICAATVLSEIGPTIDAFETDGHLASWAGLCPGSYESAGIKKSSHITQGNRYLKQALTMSGLIAAHSKDPAFSSLYNRISLRGSKMKAVIACAHKILRTIYKLLSTHQPYQNEKALGLRQQF
ncbi:Mobile element protein [Streptococcus oralis]|uniref:Mobile element protein n=1 Tax=Streptococcus oralis TaxID=1303 RepID=A0A139REG9_STROR|nr:Mobile element protein [Streptococcus oralis]